MDFTINDVDQVIERTNCSYKEAKEALMETNGDVIDAIIYLDNRDSAGTFFRDFIEDSGRTADSIMETIKEAIRKGDVTRIEVRDRDGKTLTSISVNVGAAVGTFALLAGGAPLIAISALVARFGLEYRFVIVKEDGSETIL